MTVRPRVHQVLATLGYGDAIGNEVLGVQRVLRSAGYESDIFVETADRRFDDCTIDYREMVGAIGVNVSWVFALAFVLGCLLAGLGGALVSPTVSITLGMDHTIIIEAFLSVTIGGLGNIWGALVGSLIFGVSQSIGVLILPQFAIVFPYLAVVVILTLKPTGLLKSVW